MRGLYLSALVMILAILLLAGCGGEGKQASVQPGFEEVIYPSWWDVQDNPDMLNCFGTATKVSQDLSYQEARNNAMLEASQYVDQRVKGMVKSYEEENGVENPQVTSQSVKVIKSVTDASFSGATVSHRAQSFNKTTGRYTTYVCISIPKNTIGKNLRDAIKNEEALYNAFKSSQAFQELDKEIEQGK